MATTATGLRGRRGCLGITEAEVVISGNLPAEVAGGSDYRLVGREEEGRVEMGIEGLLGIVYDRILPVGGGGEGDLGALLYRFRVHIYFSAVSDVYDWGCSQEKLVHSVMIVDSFTILSFFLFFFLSFSFFLLSFFFSSFCFMCSLSFFLSLPVR